jgi:unsaturated chondroitin disaccharide hydrolase
MFKRALDDAIADIRERLDEYVGSYPHVSTNGSYKKEPNALWTSSFWIGMVYLCYDYTRDERFLKHRDGYLNDFKKRLETGYTDTHDLGFLFTLSSVALYKLTGDKQARRMAIEAAYKLAKRYHKRGKYIKAWENETMKVDLMIDTMMNLPLLFWAAEESGDGSLARIAVDHAKTTAKTLVRHDGSTYHIYLVDLNTGTPLTGKTYQGRCDESTWARGQAWAIYGFALCYKYTRDRNFLQFAKKAADYFLTRLPQDSVPYWDLSFTDQNPDLKDSSAASIAVCGLLELATHLDGSGDMYLQIGKEILSSLYQKYYNRENKALSSGLILEGVYHRNDGANEFTIWGDYFYLEALVRVNKQWRSFW